MRPLRFSRNRDGGDGVCDFGGEPAVVGTTLAASTGYHDDADQ
jgi:hypothetical protein